MKTKTRLSHSLQSLRKLVGIPLFLATLGLLATPLAKAQVVYVDADFSTNTTLADGSAALEGTHFAADAPAADGFWDLRSFANDSSIISSNNTGPEDAPGLRTRISGLTPGEVVEITAYFWGSVDNNWRGRAGLINEANPPGYDSGHLTTSDFAPMSHLRGPFDPDNPGPLSPSDTGGDPAFENGGYFSTNSVEVGEGNRFLAEVNLGRVTIDGTGTVDVYINDFANANSTNRTWYDGLGYRIIPAIPVITAQPNSPEAILGDDVTLSVSAEASEEITFQWRRDGVDLPGETNPTLVIAAADLSDAAAYRVVATTTAGSTTSEAATLSLTLPEVSPASLVLPPFPASMAIEMPANGQNYSYQWLANGSPIPGATEATLTINSASPSDNGELFQVQVTLADGPLTSTTGSTLVVSPPPAAEYPTTIASDLPAAYLRLDENEPASTASDTIGGNENFNIGTSTVLGVSGPLLGEADTAMRFDGLSTSVLNGQGGAADPDLNTPLFTVEFWGRPTGGSGRRMAFASRLVDGTSGAVNGYEVGLNAAGQWEFRTGQGASQDWNTLTGPAAALNEWTHVMAVYDGSEMTLYLNGLPAGDLAAPDYTPQTSVASRIGGGTNEINPAQEIWVGDLDEVAYYSSTLSGASALDHYLAAFAVTSFPEITSQPQSVATLIGEEVTLEVGVISATPLSYQWQKDGIDLPDANGPTLSFSPLEVFDGGSYSVNLTNDAGTVSSDAVDVVPLQDYIGTFVLPDESNTILKRNGSPDWFVVNDAPSSNADDLWNRREVFGIFPSITPYGYQAVAATDDVLSSEVQTTMSGLAPGERYAVWTHMARKSGFTNGIRASFGDEPTRQIPVADMIETGLTAVSTADPWAVLYGLIGVQTADASGEIRVNVAYYGSGGRTVYNGLGYQLVAPTPEPPTISVPPGDLTIPVGQEATLTVAASSLLPFTYQWQRASVSNPGSFTNLVGESGDTLTLNGGAGDSGGIYRCVVTNAEGSTISEEAFLVPVTDLVGEVTWPDSANTVLVRNGSSTFSDVSAAFAQADSLWTERADITLPGQTHGYLANTTTNNSDLSIRTTIDNLAAGSNYAVWALYAFETGTTGDRLSTNFDGLSLKSLDDDALDTGLDTGGTGQFDIYHGLIGVRRADPSGEIAVVSDFQGLTRTMLLGYGVQSAIPLLDLELTVEQAEGNVILTFPQGILQQSSDLGESDAWEDVPGAVSPYLVPEGTPASYFRLRR